MATYGYVHDTTDPPSPNVFISLFWQDGVIDKDLTAPPGSPSNGDRYIIPTGATGAWAGHETEIAEW
ncbi:MAG: DUF2793 domain-containing protein, partial [Planctomycetales bacterium]|nr:DUF2793 domain-containing protein [Planctomycetales bacterium]